MNSQKFHSSNGLFKFGRFIIYYTLPFLVYLTRLYRVTGTNLVEFTWINAFTFS